MATRRWRRWQALVALAIGVSVCGPVCPAADVAALGGLMAGRLERLVLPSLSFVDTPLDACLADIRMRSSEVAPDGQGINLVTFLAEEDGSRRISAHLTEASVGVVLRGLCERAGLRLVVEEYAVIVVGPTAAGLPTEHVPGETSLPASIVSRLRGLQVPHFESDNTPLAEVCRQLTRRVFETATGDAAMGFRLVASPAVGERAVTALCLDRVPLHEVLRFVCARSGTTLRWDADTGVLSLMAAEREGPAVR